RARVRAGRRSSKPLHPRDDPAARVVGQKLAATRRSRRRAKTARAAVPDLRRSPDHAAEGVSPSSLHFPSPLWGGVRGGGRCVRRCSCITAPPPSPPLPHKGGGSRPSLSRVLAPNSPPLIPA